MGVLLRTVFLLLVMACLAFQPPSLVYGDDAAPDEARGVPAMATEGNEHAAAAAPTEVVEELQNSARQAAAGDHAPLEADPKAERGQEAPQEDQGAAQQTRLSALEAELAEAREEKKRVIALHRRHLADCTAHLEGATDEAAAARAALGEVSGVRAALEGELAAERAAVAAARTAQEDAEAARRGLEQQLEAERAAAAAALEKALAESGAGMEAEQAAVAAAQQALEELKAELEGERAAAAKREKDLRMTKTAVTDNCNVRIQGLEHVVQANNEKAARKVERLRQRLAALEGPGGLARALGVELWALLVGALAEARLQSWLLVGWARARLAEALAWLLRRAGPAAARAWEPLRPYHARWVAPRLAAAGAAWEARGGPELAARVGAAALPRLARARAAAGAAWGALAAGAAALGAAAAAGAAGGVLRAEAWVRGQPALPEGARAHAGWLVRGALGFLGAAAAWAWLPGLLRGLARGAARALALALAAAAWLALLPLRAVALPFRLLAWPFRRFRRRAGGKGDGGRPAQRPAGKKKKKGSKQKLA